MLVPLLWSFENKFQRQFYKHIAPKGLDDIDLLQRSRDNNTSYRSPSPTHSGPIFFADAFRLDKLVV